MNVINQYGRIYETSLEQARENTLSTVFDQFWIHGNERLPLIEEKTSPTHFGIPIKSSNRLNNSTCCLKRCLLICCSAIIIVLVAIGILFSSHDNNERCSSTSCISASHRIKNNLDLNENPCENFFDFACGGWFRSHSLLPSETSKSYFKSIAKRNSMILYKMLSENTKNNSTTMDKLRLYFRVCMNRTHGTYRLRTILSELGNPSSLFNLNSMQQRWNFMTTLVFMHHHRIYPLFRITVTVDERNNQHHRISFDYGTLSFDDSSIYENQEIRSIFNHFGSRLLLALNLSSQTYVDVFQSIDEIFLFEKKLAKLHPRPHLFDYEKSSQLFTYRQMKYLFYPWLNYDEYLQKIFRRNRSTFLNHSFSIVHVDYFRQLNFLLQTTEPTIVAHYLTFRLIEEFLPWLPERFLKIREPLTVRLKGVVEETLNWQMCVKKTDEAFGFATGALFIEKVFDRITKEKIEQIMKQIRQTFLIILPKIKWMDVRTRRQAKIKAKLMLNRLGYPNWLRNQSHLDEFYKNLRLSSNNDSLENFLLVQKFHKQKNLEKYDQKPDLEEWAMNPVDVNAYYAPGKNMIVFPAGILQKPFFDPNVPMALNFGSIASIIGHELVHAFDSSGRYFDGYGNRKNWWQKTSNDAFNRRAECFVDQYNQYQVNHRNIDGRQTLDENIADNGGVRIAYTAYHRYRQHHYPWQQRTLLGLNFSDEQLFFLGFAQTWCTKTTYQAARMAIHIDVHAHPKYRVIGSLSNMPEFSRAFQCSSNSSMNPQTRCQLWSPFDQT